MEAKRLELELWAFSLWWLDFPFFSILYLAVFFLPILSPSIFIGSSLIGSSLPPSLLYVLNRRQIALCFAYCFFASDRLLFTSIPPFSCFALYFYLLLSVQWHSVSKIPSFDTPQEFSSFVIQEEKMFHRILGIVFFYQKFTHFSEWNTVFFFSLSFAL